MKTRGASHTDKTSTPKAFYGGVASPLFPRPNGAVNLALPATRPAPNQCSAGPLTPVLPT